MSEFLYGTYGFLADSVTQAAESTPTIALYVGTAPVNLIRGFADAKIINFPVRVSSLGDAQTKIGVSSDWGKYTLSEACVAHFDNAMGNIGPIYVINVLDPDVHKKGTQTTKSLTFVNGRASFASKDIILDTFAIANKAEGTDYNIYYDFNTEKVNVVSANEADPLVGTIAASFYEVDTTGIATANIIGSKTEAGVYTGLRSAELLYQNYKAVPNLFAAPGWSQFPEVYKALVAEATKLNGHWDGFVYADIPLTYTTDTYTEVTPASGANPHELGYYELADDQYILTEDTTVDESKTYYTKSSTESNNDTIAKTITWKENNGYTNERSKVFWPKALGTDGNVYNLSTLAMVETLRIDLAHDGVPFETCGNKEIAVTKQYFGATSTNAGYDVTEANKLCENGIATLAFWGDAWRIWGDSTAAYTFGGDMDARDIFDVSLRMLFYLTNRFQRVWAPTIDKPFTLAVRDRILTREQENLDALVALGALIGKPKIIFESDSNPLSEIREGNFRFDIQVTPTPPLRSARAYVAYTDAGFSAYFE